MPTRRPDRVPLSRERALSAALELADAEGISALTMRRLAQALGVEAMSLYHHVANKDDILDGMVDLVFGEIELPGADDDWVPDMLARARSMRAALTRHPWAITLMSRISPGPATLQHHDAVIGCCRRAGFSVEMAAHAFSAIDSYVYGFVLQEITLPFDSGTPSEEAAAAMLAPFASGTYPHLAELAMDYVMAPGYDYGDEFDYGLVLVVSGLERAARK